MSISKHEQFKDVLLDVSITAIQAAKIIDCTVQAVYCLRYKLRNSEKLKNSKEKYRKKNHKKILKYQRQYGSIGSEQAKKLGKEWSSADEILLYKGTAPEVALKVNRTANSVYRKRSRLNTD